MLIVPLFTDDKHKGKDIDDEGLFSQGKNNELKALNYDTFLQKMPAIVSKPI